MLVWQIVALIYIFYFFGLELNILFLFQKEYVIIINQRWMCSLMKNEEPPPYTVPEYPHFQVV